MRFAFTDDQIALRDGARDVLASMCTLEDVRAQLESLDLTQGRSDERWAALADLGAVGILASEDHGGLGLSDVELIGIVEASGEVCLPVPLWSVAGVAVPLLEQLGQAELVAEVADGSLRIAVGGVDIDPEGPVIAARDGVVITERVDGASRADLYLLAIASDQTPELHLVPRAGTTVTAQPSLDPTRDLGAIEWQPSSVTLVASGADAAVLIDELATRQCLYAAAQLCGLTQAMLAMTASYAVDRMQFNKPIGSFQAIKHLLADVRIGLEFARPAVYRAAWALSVDEGSQHHDAALAKALSSQLGVDAAATCLQVHGGIGYTWEHDLQLLLKRTWALAAAHGDAATQRARALGLGLDL